MSKLLESANRCKLSYEHYHYLKKKEFLSVVGRIFHSDPGATAKVSLNNPDMPTAGSIDTVIHLGTYNYSGLNNHPDVVEAGRKAFLDYGTSSCGVRMLNGTFDVHLALEKQLAKFVGKPACLTYSSGYAANTGVLGNLCEPGDTVFSDQQNHRSIIEGLKISGADVVVYRHSDMNDLEDKIKKHNRSKRRFVVTDGVFSMDGDIAKLPDIIALARQYSLFTILDDAHGLAAMGPCGQGTAKFFNLQDQVDIITGSLSKGIPAIGGFVAAERAVIESLYIGSGSYLFSASIPPAMAVVAKTSLDILDANPEIQKNLHNNARYLVQGLNRIGLDTLQTESAVIPVMMPDDKTTLQFARTLHDHNVFVNPITYPGVDKDAPRQRINVSTVHTKAQLDVALEAFKVACATHLG
ncbi:aminotransferase class I/II-fold pyridoxal phosphate-dependent enzyme [Sansalvadorimonas verongulae]|uniref:aminotransferase class I/II-fold pyridoxal phosphate-dependent enzyme n=1 Tax=Sansalvadorimonas verongulae TaxID=2172824 RepID=UPI0018AD247E|nr:aminotransferase class I/II-fold pyridoxal phosphate-dependent enzyme [Sansalvadorimonas verongulae]